MSQQGILFERLDVQVRGVDGQLFPLRADLEEGTEVATSSGTVMPAQRAEDGRLYLTNGVVAINLHFDEARGWLAVSCRDLEGFRQLLRSSEARSRAPSAP